MRKFILTLLIVAGVCLALGSPEITPPQWAEHYGVSNRRSAITQEELPFIAFIPGFGPETIEDLASNLPITAATQLEKAIGKGKKRDILLALYDLTGAEQPSQTPSTETRELLEAEVTRVVDGDTIDVRLADRREERVRYIGMDTPEIHGPVECYGQEASAYNDRLVGGKTVWLELDVEERDRYQRLLAYVYLDSDGQAMVNAILLSQGYAQVLTIPPNVRYADRFLKLQQEAREAGRGLWGSCP
jgi:endonuclease YncB( thermonuclease family)